MYLKLFIIFSIFFPISLFALNDGANVDYGDMLSKMPTRYDPIEAKKIGEDHIIEKQKNNFRYTKWFISLGFPTNKSVALTNMDSSFYFPPAIDQGQTQTDLIKDEELEKSSGYYLALDYRMLDGKYTKGFRLSGTLQKQSAIMSKVLDTSVNLSVEDVDVPFNYAIAYDYRAYNLILNYDLFIFSRDWVVPYVGVGFGKEYFDTIGHSQYRKKTCEPQEPGTGGQDTELPPVCTSDVSEEYDLISGWNNIDIVAKVGLNIYNGYIFIDYLKYIGKDKRANSTTSQVIFGFRIPI